MGNAREGYFEARGMFFVVHLFRGKNLHIFTFINCIFDFIKQTKAGHRALEVLSTSYHMSFT